MNEKMQFISVTRADGYKMVINVDQIVCVIALSSGHARIITTSDNGGGELKDMYHEVITMLPSVVSYTDIS